MEYLIICLLMAFVYLLVSLCFINAIEDSKQSYATQNLQEDLEYTPEVVVENIYKYWRSRFDNATTQEARLECLMQAGKTERVLNELMTIKKETLPDDSANQHIIPEADNVVPLRPE